MLKKLSVVLLCLVLTITLFGCGGSNQPAKSGGDATQPIKIKVACDNVSGGPWDAGFKEFMRLVEEKVPGKVEFQYYPDGQLSNNDQRTTMEMIQTGGVHIAAFLPSIYEQFDQRWSIYGMPYLFTSIEEARASCDGEAGKYMLGLLEEKGIHGLALWEQGMRHLTTSKKAVRVPADIAGMKIRVMDSPSFIEMMKQLNALPLVTSMGELYTALQQGAADGQENPITTIYDRKLYEAQDYVTLTGHVYNPLILGINKAFWETLPADIQQAISEAAVEATPFQRKAGEDLEAQKLDALKQAVEVIELTPEEIAQWKEATKGVAPKFKDVIGQEILDLFGIK
ncbi:MAG TPA: TRAP transporter substrate-binding protein [Peptococcaceae bacterium]|nr:TRAP transporter substrate-binding protein [Peptococcaceae bacterium]